MEKSPKISVIISTYNRKEYLEIAIDSVLEQTYKNIEFIIIDDNSIDGTKEFLEKYKNDERFTIHNNKKNQGPGINRRLALENFAKGEYIIFLDDDDKFVNNCYFEKAIELFKKNSNLSMVGAAHVIYNKLTNTTTEVKFPYKEIVDNKEFFINFQTEKFIKPITDATIFKVKALEEAGYKNMKILNDTTIFLRALLWGSMGFINETCTQYLIHGNNISFNCDINLIIQTLEEKYKIYKKAKEYFDITEEKLKEWFYRQCDITMFFFIKGSKPGKITFMKLINWCKKRIKDKNKIKEYKEFYRINKLKEKEV